MKLIPRIKRVWRAACDEWRITAATYRAPVCVTVSTAPFTISTFGGHKPAMPECEYVRPTLDAIAEGTFEVREHWVTDTGAVRYGKKPEGCSVNVGDQILADAPPI
jgi:hypothetical protein